MSDAAHWRQVADQWIAWARTPGHDAFWYYRDALAVLLGPGPGSALDLGCGEGRVARLLDAQGWQVTALDAVPAMVEAARTAGSAERYLVADATALPLPDAAFDLVVAYNVLMDVDDLAGTAGEIARVLRPDGRAVISIVHPVADLLALDLASEEGGYFQRRRFEAREERDGLTMHFAGWTAPLQDYVGALAAAGLAVTALHEPRPARPDPGKWGRIPLFLWLEARPWPEQAPLHARPAKPISRRSPDGRP